MNKQFVIVATILTVILIGILISTALLRNENRSASPTGGTVAIPTLAPAQTTSKNTFPAQQTSLFPSDQLQEIDSLMNILPYSHDGLTVDYSSLLDRFYIQNEATDEAELNKFLNEYNLQTLYTTKPDKFRKVSGKPSLAIQKDELQFNSQLRDEDTEEQKTTLSYEEQRQQNRTISYNTLVRNILSFQIPNPTTTPRLNLVISGQSSPTQLSDTISPTYAPITYSGDTTQIPCGAGRDQGVADGYKDGKLFKIRICRVQGMNINSQVSKQVDQMISTARAAGINLTGGSFRDMNGQIAIYQAWCKRDGIVGSPPPYPKAPGQTVRCPGGGAPGYSNHQMGMAIDFNCDGALIPKSYAQASQNKCFQWLQSNASQYGFHELGMGKESSRSGPGYEGWHWSVNGN